MFNFILIGGEMKAHVKTTINTLYAVLFFGFVGFFQVAGAVPITRYLYNVQFSDSATATGYITY